MADRVRPSHDAELPDDVTDALLWRLAYDVAAAHQPDETGACPSPLCAHHSTPCPPLVLARRAMRVARGGGQSATREDVVPTGPEPRRAAA